MFGFFKRYDAFLCPEVRGRITLDGEPVAGVKILREVIYDDAHVETTKTLSDGSFSFPQLSVKSGTPGKAFDETRTRQVVVAEYNGERVLLWLYATGSVEREELIAEKLSQLNCDLSDEEIHHHYPKEGKPSLTYNIKSACRW